MCVHPVPVVESPAGETVPGVEELAQKDAPEAGNGQQGRRLHLSTTVMQPSDRRSATFVASLPVDGVGRPVVPVVNRTPARSSTPSIAETTTGSVSTGRDGGR